MQDYEWRQVFDWQHLHHCTRHKRHIKRVLDLSVDRCYSYVYLPDNTDLALLVTEEDEHEPIQRDG